MEGPEAQCAAGVWGVLQPGNSVREGAEVHGSLVCAGSTWASMAGAGEGDGQAQESQDS